MMLRWRPILVAALAASLLAVPAIRAEAKLAVKKVTKTFCNDLSLPVPDGPESGDLVGNLVSTGKRCPKKLVCGYGGLPLGAQVLDVDPGIRVSHPSVGDLNVLLVDPVGIMTPLTATGNGAGAADFGSGAGSCKGRFTVFDDSAASSIRGIGAGSAPFAGSFRPQQPLAAHLLTFGAGDWRFYFDDVVAGNAGRVEALSLRLRYRYLVRRREAAE